MANVRNRQKAITSQMLRLNASGTMKPGKRTFDEWKIFIYDKPGQDIISPLWSVKELREYGVTLHLSLMSQREPVKDAPAVYFVMPSEESVNRICEDFRQDLYQSYYINFLTHSSRLILERLAECAVEFGVSHAIKKVYDQYTNFICLEDNFFVLTHHDERLSFYSLNRSDLGNTEIDRSVNQITDGLFSLLITIGSVPLIRCCRGGYAEAVARALDARLRSSLNDTKNNYFTGDTLGQISLNRPLLVILDRTFDLGTMLCHSWTYQSLLHDVMDMRLNRVTIPGGTKNEGTTYDLDPSDSFWEDHKGSVFPRVAEDIQQELDTYRNSEEEIKRLKAAFGMTESSDDKIIGMLSNTTAKLTSAVGSLPQLLEKKRLLDMHTNIATALLERIKERKLDVFFDVEEKVTANSLNDRSLDELILSENGTVEDRIRLLMLYYIFLNPSNSELSRYCEHLSKAGCAGEIQSAIKFLHRWKSFTRALMDVRDASTAPTTTSMFSDLLSKASRFAMEGVKNFVVKHKKMPITRIMEQIMENRPNAETDTFACFDPKRSGPTSESKQKTSFNDAIVFVIGGGNYIEYTNLEEFRKEKSLSNCEITYGSTQLLSPHEFLTQLCKLGNEIL